MSSLRFLCLLFSACCIAPVAPARADIVFYRLGGAEVMLEGTTTIKRSDFGITTFIPMVSDEVELDITTAFEKQ